MPSLVPSWLSKAASDLSRAATGLWPRQGGTGWWRTRWLLPSARFNWEREAGDLWRNSTVALGLAWLGDRFPRPRVTLSRVTRGGDYAPVGRHPLVDLWNRPNAFYNRRTMEKAIGLSLKVDGNAYIYKVRDRSRRVVELWYLPHFRVAPTWPADGGAYLDGYLVEVDGRTYPVPPEDMIHIRDGYDPRNERLGLSALKSALREVVSLNLADTYTAAILKNSGVPSVVITPDQPNMAARMGPDAKERTKKRFEEEFTGDEVGRPIIMDGPYTVTPLGFSPEQLALDRLVRSPRMMTAAALGVALMSLGLEDPNKTYANLGEANRTSWGTVVSIQELIAEAVQHQLFADFGLDPAAYAFVYDYSEIQELQEALDAIHKRTREDWMAGIIRLNEAREQLGYDPDPDGDRYYPATGDPSEPAPTPAIGADGAPVAPPLDKPTPGKKPSATEGMGKALEPANGHASRWQY
jgi:HK97 family phage portal protein